MFKICKVCGKEFECYDKPKSSSHGSSRKGRIFKRPYKAVTCSPKCSSIYYYDRKIYSESYREALKQRLNLKKLREKYNNNI